MILQKQKNQSVQCTIEHSLSSNNENLKTSTKPSTPKQKKQNSTSYPKNNVSSKFYNIFLAQT